jgi:alpha-acetolactate decarboxylase
MELERRLRKMHIKFAPGERVKHWSFGNGTVQAIDGNLRLVMFDGKAGQRKSEPRFLRF